ncbi:odorant receptor 13a [Diachasma alloeum]|uniref:Odorant receptor n=1 Tax=Diachasma alloeum TaxID=454923 RepID=A0A4E0RKE3_9HYME|nr:odorant receptor 13a [Diachasma alloeum]THK33252.1 odorant receptor 18 [Diachasma alloeum]
MTKAGGKSQVNGSVYENEDFVYSYGWNRVMMHAIGGWPEDNDNFFMRNRIFLNGLALFLFNILPQSASVPVFRGDLNALIECLSVNLAISLSLLELVWLGIQRPTVQKLLKMMAEDWLMERTVEEHEEMMKMTKIIRLISSLSFYGTICLFIVFVSVQILAGLALRNDPNVDPRLSIGFLYSCVFPFDTSSRSVFIPIWIGQFFCTYISMAGYSSPVSFLGMFVFHQCGQLKLLRLRLEGIVDNETMGNPREFWRRLGKIVERHEQLNERTSEIEENFNKIFLAAAIDCIFVTCTQGFAVITVLQTEGDFPVFQMIFLFVFTTYDLGHFFVYCLAGDILMTESSNFGVSLYNSQWYKLAPNEVKAVLIFTSRCILPQKITGGKFTALSLPLFANIVKTAASYLSVLLAMKV